MNKYLIALMLLIGTGQSIAQDSTDARRAPISKPKPLTEREKIDRFLKRYLSTWDTCSNPKVKTQLYRGFEQLAVKDTSYWTTQYYAGFYLALTTFSYIDSANQENWYDRALMYTERAIKLNPNESESVLLKGMILGMKIGSNPELGKTLGPQSSMLYAEAKKLNPENPRVYLELGESAMYTPEQYGGGKKIAVDNLTKAVEKFKTFKYSDPLLPHWGEERAKSILEKAKKLK